MIFKIKELEQLKAEMMKYINFKHRKFSYALERNIERFDAEIKKASIKMYNNPLFAYNKDLDHYLKELKRVESTFGKKDELGKLKRKENGEIIPTKPAQYKNAIKVIKEQNSKALSSIKDRQSLITEMYNTEVEVNLYLIQHEELLPDEFSVQDRANLRFMFVPEMIPNAEIEE